MYTSFDAKKENKVLNKDDATRKTCRIRPLPCQRKIVWMLMLLETSVEIRLRPCFYEVNSTRSKQDCLHNVEVSSPSRVIVMYINIPIVQVTLTIPAIIVYCVLVFLTVFLP